MDRPKAQGLSLVAITGLDQPPQFNRKSMAVNLTPGSRAVVVFGSYSAQAAPLVWGGWMTVSCAHQFASPPQSPSVRACHWVSFRIQN
jgi:hypothetical protein